MGRCHYFVGVDDDGRHSLLNYCTVAQSAMIIECIARSLNAVVVERVMIQGECHKEDSSPSTPDSLTQTTVRRYETPVFYHEFHQSIQYKGFRMDDTDSDSSSDLEENPNLTDSSQSPSNHSPSISSYPSMADLVEPNNAPIQLSYPKTYDQTFINPSLKDDNSRRRTFDRADGIATRCELTVQRVETHLLDTSPISIADLAQKKHTEFQYRERLLSNVSDGICAATEAFALLSTTSHGSDPSQASPPSSTDPNHSSNINGGSNANISNNDAFNPNHASNNSNQNNQNGNQPNKSDQDDSSDDDSPSGLTTLCETLSSRNIRVAVVGNVVRSYIRAELGLLYTIYLFFHVHTFT